MKAPLSALIGVFFCTISFSQSLSIQEAVLGKNDEFSPQDLEQLQWVEDKDYYSYVEDKTLLVKDVKGKLKFSVSLDDLNSHLKEIPLSDFPGITWMASDRFRFTQNKVIYAYNVNDKSLRVLSKAVGKAENLDFNEASNHIAYTRENNLLIANKGENKTITDNEKGIVSGQAIARWEFGIAKGTFWSDDGQKLAFYEKDERKVTEYPLVDYSTNPASYAPTRYPMAGQTSEEGRVGIYNLNSGKTIYLKGDRSLGSEHYVTNIAWNPNGEVLYVAEINRDQNLMKLNEYGTDSGTLQRTLFQETDEKYVEPEHPPIFSEGNMNSFVWFSERDGFNHIYHYQSDGKLIRQLTEGEFPITSFLGFDSKGANCFVQGTGKNPTESHVYKVNMKSGTSQKLTSETGYHTGMISPSGSYFIDSWSSMEIPNRIQIKSTSGKLVNTLLDAPNPLAKRQIGTTNILTIENSSGHELFARMIKPSNFDPTKQYPVIVYLYNGPHIQLVQNRWMAKAPLWMHSIAEEGYIVWTIDGRGSGNRGLEFEQALFRQMGSVELEDQIAGIEYLKKLRYVDPNRMAIHGWSYGGFMTISLMLKYPDVFKVGVAGGPVIDWKSYEVMYTERYMDRPDENPEGYENADLKNHAAKLKGDLMIIQGTEDGTVVMQHSMNFLQKCVEQGVQVDFYPYPGHEHNVRGKDRVHLMTKVLDYIKEKL